jgi:hypothetical protein
MPTEYYGTPSIYQRILSADLIVLGKVQRLLSSETLVAGSQARVYGLFEVAVDTVLLGEPPSSTVKVRVLGQNHDGEVSWIVPMVVGEPYLFILVRDVSPDEPINRFAPNFAGVYPLRDGGRIAVPADAVDEATRKLAHFDGVHLTLDGVRSLITHVQEERQAIASQVEKIAPAGIRERPYPTVEEMPKPPDEGGAPGVLRQF